MNPLVSISRQPSVPNTAGFQRELSRQLERMGRSGDLTTEAITRITEIALYTFMRAHIAFVEADFLRDVAAARGELTPARSALLSQIESDMGNALRAANAAHVNQVLAIVNEAMRKHGPLRHLLPG